eukprot:gnl/TRDRNA2_/TRDRNA2_137837_c0_seq2.p1 gnl/TRDRNA2_/TRDRNA2_137837_c0~~gnl/TRDRNA2_/TRDRNA2_137837_c0_seq2.p1  ORF type:complete len:420 (+),score=110.21 gnl/TRDRNA2_/TRDRNA2_137837_c0_seq2:73-1332(+)
MDIMFDQQYMVEGEEVPIKLAFKDVIFVMEDVDAASKVVQRRDGGATSAVKRTEVVDAPKAKPPWQLFLESNEEQCKELVTMLMEKSSRLKEWALSSSSVCSIVKGLVAAEGLDLLVGGQVGKDDNTEHRDKAKEALSQAMESTETTDRWIGKHAALLKARLEAGGVVDDELVDELLGLKSTLRPKPLLRAQSAGYSGSSVQSGTMDGEEDPDQPMDPATMMAMMASMMDSDGKSNSKDMAVAGPFKGSSYEDKKDKLNLSGLLNVLDGVVDTPERILIMTTNHPEQLDPALIRPGRIDKKILLGYMASNNVVSMINHYFQCELNEAQRHRCDVAIRGNDQLGLPALEMTPAQIEQLASEHDEVENLIIALEKKGGALTLGITDNGDARPATAVDAGTPVGPGKRPPLQRARSIIYFDK